MSSLVQDLQDLLVQERDQVEAIMVFEIDLEDTDPDIRDGVEELKQASSWMCQGLYHRILHLGDTPTLVTGDLPQRLLLKTDLHDRLRMLCSEQNTLLHKVNEIRKRDDPDKQTCEFMDEAKRLHHQCKNWCDGTLAQWKHESYLPR